MVNQGDAYSLPLISRNSALTVYGAQAFPPSAGETATDIRNWFEIKYNPNEWELSAVQTRVQAHQTFTPVTGAVDLSLNLAGVVETPSGTQEIPYAASSIQWTILDANTPYQRDLGAGGLIAGAGVTVNKLWIAMDHRYTLPIPALVTQYCYLTDIISVVMAARVNNPTTTPSWGEIKSTGHAADWHFDLPLVAGALVIGVIGIGGLFALGYASEKTGVNAGILGGVYNEVKGIYNGAVKGISKVLPV